MSTLAVSGSKQEAVNYKLSLMPQLLEQKSYHGAYATHAPLYATFPILTSDRTGAAKDLATSVVRCGMPVNGIKRFCGQTRFCSYCAYRAFLKSIKPKLALTRSSQHKLLFVTYSYTQNCEFAFMDRPSFNQAYDQIHTHLKKLLKSGLIEGYLYGEELHINSISQSLVLPHIHLLISSQTELHTIKHGRYIPIDELIPDIENISVKVIPVDSDLDAERSTKYFCKPLDFARLYEEEAKTINSEILNNRMEQMLSRYVAFTKQRRRSGAKGTYLNRKRKNILKPVSTNAILKTNMLSQTLQKLADMKQPLPGPATIPTVTPKVPVPPKVTAPEPIPTNNDNYSTAKSVLTPSPSTPRPSSFHPLDSISKFLHSLRPEDRSKPQPLTEVMKNYSSAGSIPPNSIPDKMSPELSYALVHSLSNNAHALK